MSSFAQAGVVFAGVSNAAPQRDFIVRAGSSIPENRDYIVVLKRNFQHLGGVVTISSSLLTISDFNRIQALPGVVQVVSSPAGLTLYSSLLLSGKPGVIQVASSGIAFRRFIEHLTGTVQVLSSTAELVGPPLTALGFLPLGVASGAAALNPFAPTVLSTESGSIEVRSGLLILRPTDQAGSMELGSSAINVGSGNANLSYQYLAELQTSVVEVRSSNTRFFNPYLVGVSSSIAVVSSFTDLRLLATGFLPSTPPTNRSFQPPSYTIDKTNVMTGRTVRQIMCSKLNDAQLTLEYVNVNDSLADEVLDAYDESYGTRYGFKLPPEVLTGADNSLLNYITLSGSSLKWFYANPPSVVSVQKGVCNLNVQLKARVEAL